MSCEEAMSETNLGAKANTDVTSQLVPNKFYANETVLSPESAWIIEVIYSQHTFVMFSTIFGQTRRHCPTREVTKGAGDGDWRSPAT